MKTNILTSLGISEKSAKVYLAGLTLGTTSVQELARKTGLKRPTVYLHIDELVKRGLFEIASINNKQYYRAADPQVLESQLQKNLSELQSSLPELAALRTDTMGKPQIKTFEAEEGVKRVYEEMRKANSLRIWSNMTNIFPLFNDVYMELAEATKENGIGVREIIADTKEARRYSRLVAKVSGPTYVARLATVEGLANDSIVYGNVVAIFRLHEFNMFVVRIEDKTITHSMRALFDMAWKSAKSFK